MKAILIFALLGAAHAMEEGWHPIASEPSEVPTYVPLIERSLDSSSRLKIINRRPISVYSNKVTSGNYQSAPALDGSDACSVYKVSLNQELFYQFMVYDANLPDLKEFTLCMWTKFHNHSDDHPLFSYSTPNSPKEISAWISNTAQASYFSMAVHGQTFFRLNYPLKLNTWYHSCQSWNGKTGEWQLWVNAERVGRGFHNRLVGHVIKGDGIASTGQEQSLMHNLDRAEHILKKSGFIGEITMLQMYHVALTAGKAHKDHKHHHVHHFNHDGSPVDSSTEAVTEPPPPIATPLGNGNFLIGGQLQRPQNLNIAGAQQEPQMIPVQLPNGLQYQQEYRNGQLESKIVSEQLLSYASNPNEQFGNAIGVPQIQLLSSSGTQNQPPRIPLKGTSVTLSGSLFNPANVQYVEDTAPHNLFRRGLHKRDKRDNPEKELAKHLSAKKDKRGLVALSDGSVVDEALLSPSLSEDLQDAGFQQSLLDGLAGAVGNLPIQAVQMKTSDEREPAEAEVRAVMQVCSGCAPEPFKKALVLSWRSTPKKLYSGAHYYKGLPICRAF